MYTINIISTITIVVIGVVGNILYFNYRFKRENNKKIAKDQLINLLLPIYMILKTDELEFFAWKKNNDADLYEYFSDRPDRLFNPIKNILDKNLYLADDELQKHSLLFLEWVYEEDIQERFQKIHDNSLKQDVIFDEFKEVIYKRYNEQRQKYILWIIGKKRKKLL